MMLIAATMPFNIDNVNINSLCILLLGANTLVLLFSSKNKNYPTNHLLFILFAGFFVMHAVGFLYSENKHEAGLILERKLSLAVFPIVFFYGPKLELKQVRQIVLAFVVSCLLICLVSIGSAFYQFGQTNDTEVFFYHALSTNVGMHAGYLAMYLCFSLSSIMYLYLGNIRKQSLLQKVLVIAAIVILCVTIILLSARLQIILMIGLWLVFVIFRFRLHRKPIMLMATSFVLIGLMLGLILLSPKNRERFKEAINYKNEYALSKKWGEKQMRFLMWSSATDLIKEKPLFGFGTGDVQDELEKHYVANDYVSLTYWKNTRFNAHNQFMETTLALGILGLLVFLIGMIFGLKEAIKNRNRLYIVFVILFLGSCLTESMLERQNGIVFFAFFNSMLLVMEPNNTNGIKQI